jgi:diguanylate cyclase (GGDEF)-like protein
MIKIILIENNEADYALASELLLQQNQNEFTLVRADTFSAGLKLMSENDFDIALLDLSLPDSRGINSFSELHSTFPDIPIIILSDLEDEALAVKLMRHGAQDYLVKGHIDRYLLERSIQYSIERGKAGERLYLLAHYDPLTGLANRTLFWEMLNKSISAASRYKYMLSLLFLDLDNFKEINDRYGHPVGDKLLKAVATRISDMIRESDVVGRIGGDEFTVLMTNVSGIQETAIIAQRILRSLQRDFLINGKILHVAASIGIALYPYDGHDAETLMKNADSAMYQIKHRGKSAYHFSNAESQPEMPDHLELKNRILHALDKREFVLHYQPEIDLTTRQTSTLEVLIRWQEKQREMHLPAEFIPFAEENDLIFSIGEWTLLQACKQLKSWQQQGAFPGRISLNLSSKQLHLDNFLDSVKNIISLTGINPSWLEFEFSEKTILTNIGATINRLRALNELGIHISLDDFGTGYTSIAYLKCLPISKLKIDRSYVSALSTDNKAADITRNIISLAHGLDLTVVAGGVETEEQLGYLTECGCDQIQGFLFCKPLSSGDILNYIGKDNIISPPQSSRRGKNLPVPE